MHSMVPASQSILALLFSHLDESQKDESIGLFQLMRETLGFRPYKVLLLAYLFSWLAIQVYTETNC